MAQQRTDGRYNTRRAISRVEHEVARHLTPPKHTHTTHALIASEPLQWATQPTVIVTPATASAVAAAPAAATAAPAAATAAVAAAAAKVAIIPTGGSGAAATASAAVHKYELYGGPTLNTSVTLDTVMFSLAAGLFERGMQPVVMGLSYLGAPLAGYAVPGYGCSIPNNGNGLVQKVDVYSSAVTKAKYDARREQFAAQGISTAEMWVFHGTTSTANVHSIMTDGFKVGYITYLNAPNQKDIIIVHLV
jgi:hypothetical protein